MHIGFIPARSGSKGVHDKNIRKINDSPMLSIAVTEALNSNFLDKVIVSTDSPTYAQIAESAGAWVPFLRPTELSEDDSSIIEVLNYTLSRLETEFQISIDCFVLLEPNLPFRKRKHIDAAMDLYSTKKYSSVVSVKQLNKKPENIFVKQEDILKRFIQSPLIEHKNRQEMENLCRLNSAIYIIGREKFQNQQRLVVDPTGYVEMTEEESINIDTPVDLKLAQLIAKEDLE